MPKVNPLRSLANERNVATRIRFEREKRRWTYEGLAARMTQDGNPMQASAVYKIEKGDPPRRITVDELVSFSKIFDLDPTVMLVPMDDVLTSEARKVLGTLAEEQTVLMRSIQSMVTAHITMFRLQSSSSDFDREVLQRIVDYMPGATVTYPMGPHNHPTRKEITPDPINRAFNGLLNGFAEYAKWTVDNEKGPTNG